MQKTILVTGATDGIGFETAKALVVQGHKVLIHGRSVAKVEASQKTLQELAREESVESYIADLSRVSEVISLAKAIKEQHQTLDVLINNAGVFKTPEPITAEGQDIRFVVNTIAPYLLTKALLPLMSVAGRVINLSSAAQAPVNIDALLGRRTVSDDFSVYAQSKLALTMWSYDLASSLKESGPAVIAVNPGSLLATKMVKEGFNTEGKDIHIGSNLLVRAALAEDFASANGKYFDNDIGTFSSPHPDALDSKKCREVTSSIEGFYSDLSFS